MANEFLVSYLIDSMLLALVFLVFVGLLVLLDPPEKM